MDARVDSNYDVSFQSDPTTAEERIQDASRFVQRIAKYLFDKEGIQ
jgi:hypothetical protein